MVGLTINFCRIPRQYQSSVESGKFRSSAQNSAACGKLWAIIITTSKVLGPLCYPATQLPSGCPWREVRAQVPKTQRLKRHSRGPQPFNTTSARGVWQTDEQTNFPQHYRKIAIYLLINVPLHVALYFFSMLWHSVNCTIIHKIKVENNDVLANLYLQFLSLTIMLTN